MAKQHEVYVRGYGSVRDQACWLLTFLTMLVAVWVAFGTAASQFFIADDLANLHFVRNHVDGLADFWVPGRAYSAPVTRSRYMPLHMMHWIVFDALFGQHVWAYHVMSLLFHAAVATLIVALARKLYEAPWPVALAAGVLFGTYRLHGQMVVWVSANFRLLSTALFLSALLFLLWDARPRVSLPAAFALFIVSLLMNPDFVIAPAIVGVFAVSAWRSGHYTRARRFAMAAAVSAVAVAAFMTANLLSNRSFPDSFTLSAPSPTRIVLFFINLMAPVAAPLPFKAALTVLVMGLVWAFRQRYTLVLAAAAAASGVFWSMSNYTMAPRYLYLPAVFVTLAVTQSAWQALQAITRRVPNFPGQSVGVALVAALVSGNAYALARYDVVHFNYLSDLPQRLANLSAEVSHAQVFVTPHNPLPPGDLAFFTPPLEFVDSAGAATHIVDNGAAAYRDRLGGDFDRDYWHMPWFTMSLQPGVKRSPHP